MTTASAGWQAGMSPPSSSRGSKRAVEILGIVFAFFWFWPAAAAYVAWKVMGYPLPQEAKRWFDDPARGIRTAAQGFRDTPWSGAPFGGSGNAAFDEYRKSEIERLENERRRLDEEAREFRTFVDDLKRAKDRDEFDAYMAKRRQNGPQTV